MPGNTTMSRRGRSGKLLINHAIHVWQAAFRAIVVKARLLLRIWERPYRPAIPRRREAVDVAM
jgi:hypothetical protein